MSLHRRCPDRRSLVRQRIPSREEPMNRVRHFSVGSLLSAAVIAAVLPAPALAQTTLRVVMHSDLKIVDPVWTTAYITRNHGYMIYDTLFATDAKGEIRPQMVEKYDVSADKLTYTMFLRDGLLWHDGKPVTAEDCVASIRRWGAKDTMGQKLMSFVKDMTVVDQKTFRIVLKEQTGLVLPGLGKPSSNVPVMMPKRVAAGQLEGGLHYPEPPPPALPPRPKKAPAVTPSDFPPRGNQSAWRFNTPPPPFTNAKVRQAVLCAFDQKDFLEAVIGDPAY